MISIVLGTLRREGRYDRYSNNRSRGITMLIVSYSRRYRNCKFGLQRDHEALLYVTQILSINDSPNMTRARSSLVTPDTA